MALVTRGEGAPIALPDNKIWKVILAAAVGTMIEWYDFFIIGSLTAVLALKFYPPGNTTFAYLAYLATFAIGLVVRPFGALFFGRIGDLVGRKYAFLVTLMLMGGGDHWDWPGAHLHDRRMVRSNGFNRHENAARTGYRRRVWRRGNLRRRACAGS